MAEVSLRFGVADAFGRKASTWKCWSSIGTGKHDVYLTCRSLGGAFKASLHQSGAWHIAFAQTFLDTNVEHGEETGDNHNRFLDRWPRPPEIAPGVTLAFRILIPYVAVTVPLYNVPQQSITWLPAPPEGKAVEIAIVFTSPTATITDWPGRRTMNTKLVGKLNLDSGESVWVIHRIVDVPDFGTLHGKVTRFKSGGGTSLSEPGLRAILFGHTEDGSRFMVECVVGEKDADAAQP
jgi:hypothetical protein